MVKQKTRYKSGEKALTKADYDTMIAQVDNIEDELLFSLAVSTGLRRQDLTNIRVEDIDLDKRWMSFVEKKKGGRIWNVPLNDKVIVLIKKFMKTWPKNRKRKLLFSFSDRTAYNRLQKWLDVAGLERRPFHALRATCIKFCLAAGWSYEEVARLTGDTVEVIQKHYSTPSKDEMQQVARERSVI